MKKLPINILSGQFQPTPNPSQEGNSKAALPIPKGREGMNHAFWREKEAFEKTHSDNVGKMLLCSIDEQKLRNQEFEKRREVLESVFLKGKMPHKRRPFLVRFLDEQKMNE